MKIIEVKDLGFKYAGTDFYAIRGVNLEIDEGEFVVLAGKSGCGKTTLLRCLNGLIPHFYEGEFEGRVLIDGIDTRECPPHILSQKAGMVFQNPDNQLFALSVEADIAFPLENLGLPREEIRDRVEWALKLLGIEELRKRSPFELSAGQKQKVAIASVLAMKPKILLLDEPTSSLDPVSAKNLIDAIIDLNRRHGLTILISEHRLTHLIPHADKLAIMDRGRIIYFDDPRRILKEDVLIYGVSIPRVVEVAREMRRIGGCIPFKDIPLSVEEFISGLKGALR
ncbi:MAG: ABC transporter ATP-binding protein [Thaumarchaeota archaeon]|nr:MAG: ABC transporter ATP-binding protein [Nitrososphaerota archaeon]